MYDLILVRYGEMTLKKNNYKYFLDKINHNIREKCKHLKKLKFSNTMYRFYIYLNGEESSEVIKALNTVVGLSSYSLCCQVEADYDKIAEKAIELVNEYTSSKESTFKVETHRGNKDFPATSIDISKEVAKRVLSKTGYLKVDVHNPEVLLSIDLRVEGTYIYLNEVKGLGGYPSSMAGNGLLMMSGGLDSPVAGFLAIKKGVNVTALHFASPPYTSVNALQKVIDLTQIIAKYTIDGKMNLLVVPFTKIQEAIHNKANPIYLVTLMRRAMYKIASSLCEKRGIDVIINGESIGQVASQTLESMKVVNEVTNIPIIRPLATYDKLDIIDVAKKIDTYDTSIRPYEDCCTVFVPKHPIIKPKIETVLEEEAKCELDDLIEEAIDKIERYNLNCFNKLDLFKKDDKFDI